MWKDGYLNTTTFATCDWAVSTSDLPLRDVSRFWYGVEPAYTAATIVRLVKICEYCDTLQVKGKVKCPFCGAPYKEYLE